MGKFRGKAFAFTPPHRCYWFLVPLDDWYLHISLHSIIIALRLYPGGKPPPQYVAVMVLTLVWGGNYVVPIPQWVKHYSFHLFSVISNTKGLRSKPPTPCE